MKKKIVALCLVLALALTAIGGATLAYFTDEEVKTNTLAVGNIDITLNEKQYDWEEKKFETFVDNDFVLYPISNAQGQSLFNKYVYTTNTSTSREDAYIRTFILLEKNDQLTDSYVNEGGAKCCFPGIHFAADGIVNGKTHTVDGVTAHTCKEGGTLAETVTVGGNEYWVVWFVDSDESAIAHGEALSSLVSVHMDKNITEDQVAGWGEDGVQVIAFSQGIQEEGLTHAKAMEALGVVNKANVETWVAAALAPAEEG